MRVSIHAITGHMSAVKTCKAMAKGIEKCGDEAVIRSVTDTNVSSFDAVVLWGFIEPCQQIIRNCQNLGIPWVFIDLGYFRREKGYYKVTVNDRHPDKYLMILPHPKKRFEKLGLTIKPWRINPSGSILIAGMSGKAAWSWGLQPEEYERAVIQELQTRYPDFPIIYRPKPTWSGASLIPGTKFDKFQPLKHLWSKLWCVVSHHSNVCCEALIEGIPVFCQYGAASVLGPHDLTKIRSPEYSDNREQWAANLAYCQWSLTEMEEGVVWSYLKEVGLIRV